MTVEFGAEGSTPRPRTRLSARGATVDRWRVAEEGAFVGVPVPGSAVRGLRGWAGMPDTGGKGCTLAESQDRSPGKMPQENAHPAD